MSCRVSRTPHSTSGILCLQLLRHLPLALVDGVGPLERVRFALGALCAAEARCAGEVGCTLPVHRPRSLSPPYFSHPALACTWHTSICECLDALCRNILHGPCAHRHAAQQPFDHLLRRGVLVQEILAALCTDTPGGAWRRKLGACVAWCVRAAPPPGSSQTESAARSRLFRRAQTSGAITAEHQLSVKLLFGSKSDIPQIPPARRSFRETSTSRSAAARRSADAAARRHAWAGAAHPEPAPVPCGQPVVAAHMLTADDR